MSDSNIPSTVSIALVNTGHFGFVAVAADPDAALDAVMQVWRAHVELTGAEPDLHH